MNGEKCFLCRKPMGNSGHTWKIENGALEVPVHDHCETVWSIGFEEGFKSANTKGKGK